ncbi:MAG: hypothetical protein JWM88_1328, partial [Verrucomicrobia bacterium]|nr:hypothetical protein [Verrucomicrobiota bacterium]
PGGHRAVDAKDGHRPVPVHQRLEGIAPSMPRTGTVRPARQRLEGIAPSMPRTDTVRPAHHRNSFNSP